jgi:hypothetical protein
MPNEIGTPLISTFVQEVGSAHSYSLLNKRAYKEVVYGAHNHSVSEFRINNKYKEHKLKCLDVVKGAK